MLFPFDLFNMISFPPFYMEVDGILFNSDCLNILKEIPGNSIDLIVTDPPYGISYKGCNFRKAKNNRRNLIKNDSSEIAIVLFENFLKESKRILKKGGVCCCCAGSGGANNIFSKWIPLMQKYLHFKQAVVWDKGSIGLGYHYRHNYEMILVANKKGKRCKWNGGFKTSNIVKINKIIRTRNDHPTPKSVDLMSHFIELHSNRNDIVLDPFAGHGSTLLAAKSLKRKFIGVELEKKYCNVITQRITEN